MPRLSELPEMDTLVGPVIGFRQWLVIDLPDGSGQNRPRLCPLFQHTMSEPWAPGENLAICHETWKRKNAENWASAQQIAVMTGGEPLAISEIPPHDKGPVLGCSCGLYSYYEVRPCMIRDHIKGRITGAILARGDVMAHNEGFRSPRAEIIGLAMPTSQSINSDKEETKKNNLALMLNKLPALTDYYKVPIFPLDILELEARVRGNIIPEDMRPEKVTRPISGPKNG